MNAPLQNLALIPGLIFNTNTNYLKISGISLTAAKEIITMHGVTIKDANNENGVIV